MAPLAPSKPNVKTGAHARAETVYWHRELPPPDAEPMGEHVLEATSARTASTLAHRDELWDKYYQDLMDRAGGRLEQEVLRLGGSYAHVLQESVDSRHDDATGESWLHGCFTYMLYRHPLSPPLTAGEQKKPKE